METVLVITHLMLCLMAVHAVPTIDIPPRETTVLVRSSVTLACKVMGKGMYTASWLKYGRVISNDEAIVSSAVESSRYSIVGEPSQGNYSLRITNILTSDHDMFKCQLRAPPGSGAENVESLPVELIVQYPPAEGYPQCYPDYGGTRGLLVGQRVTFGCITETGEPPAQLKWTRNGTELASDADTSLTGFIGMNFVQNITVDDHRKSFDCILNHELLEGPRLCTVGPLDVLFPPMETIIKATIKTTPKAGSNLVLSCESKANPIVSDFKWHTIPPLNESRDLLKVGIGGNVWILSKVEAEDDGTVVVCEAQNKMGASDSTFTITVAKESTLPPPTTTPPPPKTTPAKSSPPPPKPTPPKSTLATKTTITTPYVFILILIAVALLLLTITLVIIAVKKKKRPATVITVADLDNLHADVHSLASFGGISRHGTPYMDRLDYEMNRNRSRSHSRDYMFDTESLDSASALVMRGLSSDSPTRRKYSVDSLGKTHVHTQFRDHQSHRPSNGSPVHKPAKRLDSSPHKERNLSESAHSQSGRPLPKIGPVVDQNVYAEVTPVSGRKQYAESTQLSVTTPESGYCEDEVLIKLPNNSYEMQSSNNCNCIRKMSHVEV